MMSFRTSLSTGGKAYRHIYKQSVILWKRRWMPSSPVWRRWSDHVANTLKQFVPTRPTVKIDWATSYQEVMPWKTVQTLWRLTIFWKHHARTKQGQLRPSNPPRPLSVVCHLHLHHHHLLLHSQPYPTTTGCIVWRSSVWFSFLALFSRGLFYASGILAFELIVRLVEKNVITNCYTGVRRGAKSGSGGFAASGIIMAKRLDRLAAGTKNGHESYSRKRSSKLWWKRTSVPSETLVAFSITSPPRKRGESTSYMIQIVLRQGEVEILYLDMRVMWPNHQAMRLTESIAEARPLLVGFDIIWLKARILQTAASYRPVRELAVMEEIAIMRKTLSR